MRYRFNIATLGRWDPELGLHIIRTEELGLPQASSSDDIQATALLGEWSRGRIALEAPEDVLLAEIDASIQGVLRRDVLEHYLSNSGRTFDDEPSSWGALGPLAVAPTDGRTVLIDGNHRWACALIEGKATFRAQILRPGALFPTGTDWGQMLQSQLTEGQRGAARS
ncbi:hypothetical protein [uncultured Amnibacterium sp.]|uniref:hypothetical protein n=1 Tax=uncultured Amnibacterium sp. TaxID=1631851 RepID=UPI0035CC5304